MCLTPSMSVPRLNPLIWMPAGVAGPSHRPGLFPGESDVLALRAGRPQRKGWFGSRPHSKGNITIKWVNEVFGFPVYVRLVYPVL